MKKRDRPTFSAANIAACPFCNGKFPLVLISGHVLKCKRIEKGETEEPEPKRPRVAHTSAGDEETKESPAEVQQQSQTPKDLLPGFGDGSQDYLFASNGKGKKHSKPNLALRGIVDAHIRLHLKPEKNFQKTFMQLPVKAQNDCVNGILTQIRLAFPRVSYGLVHDKVLASYNGRARNRRNKEQGKVWPSREKAKNEREAKRSEGSKDKDEGKEKDEKEKDRERDTDNDLEMESEDAEADKENRSPAAAPIPARAAKARTQSQAAIEAALENEPPKVLHMGMPVSLMAPFKSTGKSKGSKLQRIANGTILCFKPTDKDLNGNVLGDGVVLVTINGKPLTAGVGFDISHLIPPTEAEAKEEKTSKDKSEVFIDELETTRWKLSLIRARADSVAKATAAAAAAVPKAADTDGHSRVRGGAGSSSNSHGLGLGGFSARGSDSGND